MQKTKLGLSVGIVAALAYLCGLMSGYVALILIAGYVLLKEDDKWLKYSVIKAIAVTAVFDVIITIINLIPDFLDWIYSCVSLGHGYFSYDTASGVVSVIVSALRILKTTLFIILIFAALKQNTINIPIVDDLITKHNFFGGAPQQNRPHPQYNAGPQQNGQPQYNAAPQQPQYQAQGQPQYNAAPQQAPFRGQHQSNPGQFQQAPNQPYQGQGPQ